jgi:hypothetical protein
MSCYPIAVPKVSKYRNKGLGSRLSTHRSTRHSQLNLPLRRAHQLAKLLTDSFQQTQPVVESQCFEEVLHGIAFIRTSGVLMELGNDRGLVCCRQGWGLHNLCKFGIFVVYLV